MTYRKKANGRPDATTAHPSMQAHTPADLRAKKARLGVTYEEIGDALAALGYPYKPSRLWKVFREHEVSAPVLQASAEALDAIEAERAAAAHEEAPALS